MRARIARVGRCCGTVAHRGVQGAWIGFLEMVAWTLGSTLGRLREGDGRSWGVEARGENAAVRTAARWGGRGREEF